MGFIGSLGLFEGDFELRKWLFPDIESFCKKKSVHRTKSWKNGSNSMNGENKSISDALNYNEAIKIMLP